MDSEFAGKRVLVTGAGRGIGKDTAIALAKLGAEVIAVSKTEENLKLLVSEVPSIKPVTLDISDWKETQRVIEGLLPIHHLVNNAGVISLQSVGEITEDEVDKVLSVNVKAALNIAQVVAKGMKAAGIGGSIVNVSSQAAIIALHKHTTYCASKGALDQITKCLALELGPHQIRVNSVNPTVVLTDMGKAAWGDPVKAAPLIQSIPLRKFAQVADVVNAILFLLSNKSGMTTGASLPVEGGYIIQ